MNASRIIRTGLIMLVLLVCAFSFQACSKDTKVPDDGVTSPAPTNTVVITNSLPNDDGETETTKLISIRYYIVDTDKNELLTIPAMVPEDEEIRPEAIMEYIIDSMADRSVKIGLDGITTEGNTVIVSFTDSIKDIAEESKDLENAILDAVAQSMIDNIESCSSVAYRIAGKEYVTANHSFAIGDIYMEY